MSIHDYNRFIKNCKTLSPSAGFTLTEVLVAAMLTTIVMMIAGMGLVNMLRSNYKANAASEIRNNIDRTIEFVSDEVRRAEFIADDLSKVDSTAKDAIEAKGGKVVLAVRLPEYQDQIIYYTKAAAAPWFGPRVLYRFGPPLATNGEFEKDDTYKNADGKYTAANWTHSPLIDMLVGEDQVTDKDCDPYRNNEKPDNNRTNDPAGWKMLPQESTDPSMMEKLDGFFVCVKGQLVMLRLNSTVPLTTKEKLTYNVDTTVYGRSALAGSTTTPVYVPTGSGGTGGSGSPGGSEKPPFECTGTSCTTTLMEPPGAVRRDDPKCDSTKNVCWEEIPVVVDKDASSKYAVKIETSSEGKKVINVIVPGINSKNGTNKYQSVELYIKDTLPRTIDISLSDKQILYILKRYSLNTEYHVVITFNTNGTTTAKTF